MPGKTSKKFAKAIHTASGGSAKKERQAHAVKMSVEKQMLAQGKSAKEAKKRAGMSAMAASKGKLESKELNLSLVKILESIIDANG